MALEAPAAIEAEFADYRPVKSRAVLQVIMEVPIERQAAVFAALGYPMPHQGIPCAIARLNPDPLDTGAESHSPEEVGQVHVDPQAGPKPPHPPGSACKDLTRSLVAKQAYAKKTPGEKAVIRAIILCCDPAFQQWVLSEKIFYGRDAAWFIRDTCGISSRGELADNADALKKFEDIEAGFSAYVGKMAELRS